MICSKIAIFHAVFVICQRMQISEMLEIINAYPAIFNSSETKKCLPAIKKEYHPEIYYELALCDSTPDFLKIYNEHVYSVNATECSGYQCWESTLTDATKLEIVDIFNMYRQTVARGTCGSWCKTNKERLIFRWLWDYHFEFEAAFWIKNCPQIGSFVQQKLPPFFMLQENVGEVFHTVFKVETGLQSELLAKLMKLLDGNYLSSWNVKTKQFRRGLTNRIGCVYVVRYGVTMITALNEHVQSGNVAHFCCFTNMSKIEVGKIPKVEQALTTTENCNKVLHGAAVKPDSMYPSLCMEGELDVKEASYPSMICQPDPKYHGDVYYEICRGSKSVKNPETWNEKFYGYIIRWLHTDNVSLATPECSLPEFVEVQKPQPSDVDDDHKLDFDCTLKHEVNLLTVSAACSGWSCDDSQLTDETRQYVLNSLNKARHLVADGSCSKLCHSPCICNNVKYCNIMKLRWHWYLESKAAEMVQNCSTEYGRKYSHYVDSPFEEPAFYEEVRVVFELPPEAQINLPDTFTELFWTNGLNDWNETDNTFRRGNAAWIGCAVVIRPGLQINDTHEDFISIKGAPEDVCCPTCTSIVKESQCRLRTAKKHAPFPYLCSSVLWPDITMSCAVNKCPPPHQQSLAWKLFVGGVTILEHLNNSLEHIQRASPLDFYNWYTSQVYSKKICKILILFYVVTLSVFCLALALFFKYWVEEKYYSGFSKK